MTISQGMKLLISYDMRNVAGQEYYQFVLGRYIPIMQNLGLDMKEAWHTAYGNGPERLIAFVAKDEYIMDDLLHNETWHDLNEQLDQFVTNFSYKVVPYKQGFQI